MRAMILAAGLGTRLRPLTDTRPKALVEIDGRTLLEITLERLRSFGVRDVIVNAHHFGDMIAEYVRSRDFGMRVEISREDELLDTGGGLKKAAHFFLQDNSSEPFILHNVDVISSVDLCALVESHRQNQALATLAVQQRESSRQLLFDDQLRLCGRQSNSDNSELVRPARQARALAFCGIHVISPRIFQLMTEEGAFSIIETYLRLAERDEAISGFCADGYYWRDVGKPESLLRAADERIRGAWN